MCRAREGEGRGPGEARTHDCRTRLARTPGPIYGESASRPLARTRRSGANGTQTQLPRAGTQGEMSRWTARNTRRRDAYPRRDPNPEETPGKGGGRRRLDATTRTEGRETGPTTWRTSAEPGQTGGPVPLVEPDRDYDGRKARRAERQEGNDRSDAKRPPTRIILRRVETTRGGGKPPRTSGSEGAQAETR